MSAPRRIQAPQIYQDPIAQNQQSVSPIYSLPPTFDAFGPGGPLSELSHNVSLNSTMPSSTMIPPSQGDFITDSLHKKPVPLMPQMSQSHRPLKPLTGHISMYHHQAQFDKENVYTPDMMSQNSMYAQKPALRASFPMDSSVGGLDRPQKKQKRQSIHEPTQTPFVLPDPNDLPAIEDDGTKPAYSYSQLIGMAILRSENRRLTLAQIYKWISNNFLFYRSQETGWQNSIRHNLSLNKAFTKQDRPKDDPGKGHYWAIQPGFEAQFLKEKSKAGNPNSGLSQHNHQKRSSIAQSISQTKNFESSKFTEEEELSSDATIPASDPNVHEGVPPQSMAPPLKHLKSSPPPANIHSSPPQLTMESLRERTPPPEHQFAIPTNRSNGGRKRKLSNLQTGLGDSGYYSSIESSATRNNRTVMTSEADMEPPTRKRGRAEEEIARIRSSSYDSPSKSRTNPTILVSSSPYCGTDPMFPGPTTPGLMFKRPMKPPTSVSPNTNLRRHRENVYKLLGSPEHHVPGLDPTFDPMIGNMFTADINDAAWLSMLEESPIRSAKRPRLERANTVTGVLADVTSISYENRRYLSPAKLFPSPLKIGSSPLKLGSPVKLPAPILNGKTSLSKAEVAGNEENDDFTFALNLPSDDSEQIDITQGFHKIGSPSTLVTSTVMQHPTQSFAFPVYPGTEENFESPSKPMRGKPEFSRRATFNL